MSDDPYDRIDELMHEATRLPYGEVQVRLLEEAVKLADVTRDLDAMFETRMVLIDSGVFSGHPEKSLPAFAWCLAQYEQDEDRYRYHERSLLWYFKNILHNADEFPQFTLEQVEKLRGQMIGMYRRCGYNMRPTHYTKLVFATRIGNRVMAEEAYARYRSIQRDSMADCLACEADSELEFFEFIDDLEQTISVAQPSLEGRVTCAEVPHRTYSYILRPLALLGRYEEADEYQMKGYPMIRGNAAFLLQISLQMAYLMHRDRPNAAVKMVERHLPWAIATFQLRSRYMFYLASRETLCWMRDNQNGSVLNLPDSIPGFAADGNHDLDAMTGWLEGEIATLGARFDARNQNQFFTQKLPARLSY